MNDKIDTADAADLFELRIFVQQEDVNHNKVKRDVYIDISTLYTFEGVMNGTVMLDTIV